MKRIYMLSSDALFYQGIVSLLSFDPELEFIGRDGDVDHGIERIHELQPDVVILDNSSPSCSTSVATQVIGLSLHENLLL